MQKAYKKIRLQYVHNIVVKKIPESRQYIKRNDQIT